VKSEDGEIKEYDLTQICSIPFTPKRFVGDNKVVWIVGDQAETRFRMFRYDLARNQIDSDQRWMENINDLWKVFENENNIFIFPRYLAKGCMYVDKHTYEIKTSGWDCFAYAEPPMSSYASRRYTFFSTLEGLAYYDQKDGSWGKIKLPRCDGYPTIIASDYGAYVRYDVKYAGKSSLVLKRMCFSGDNKK
jgi:hypothetical protein